MKQDGLELFEGVVRQVNFPPDYTAAQLKEDMLTFINGNADYFSVTNFTCFCFFPVAAWKMRWFVTIKETALLINFIYTGDTGGELGGKIHVL